MFTSTSFVPSTLPFYFSLFELGRTCASYSKYPLFSGYFVCAPLPSFLSPGRMGSISSEARQIVRLARHGEWHELLHTFGPAVDKERTGFGGARSGGGSEQPVGLGGVPWTLRVVAALGSKKWENLQSHKHWVLLSFRMRNTDLCSLAHSDGTGPIEPTRPRSLLEAKGKSLKHLQTLAELSQTWSWQKTGQVGLAKLGKTLNEASEA